MVVIALVLILPLSAQTSNLNQATSGVYKTDVDNFMDATNFGSVKFDKWFGYIGGNSAGYLTLGYATSFGGGEEKSGIYLGTYFLGNILSFDGTATKSVAVQYPDPTLGYNPTQITTTSNWNGGGNRYDVNSYNNLHALIGLGNMGFKVGFTESLYTNLYDKSYQRSLIKTEDKTAGTTTVTGEQVEYSSIYGNLIPYVTWGMKMNVKDMILRPTASFTFNILQDKFVDIYKDYTTYSGVAPAGSSTTENYYYYTNDGYLNPRLNIGASLEIPKENQVVNLGLDYTLNIRAYSNDYEAPGVSGTANGTVDASGATHVVNKYLDRTVTTDTTPLWISELSYFSHNLNPTFKIRRDINGLKLGFRAGLPVTLTTQTTNTYLDRYTVTKTSFNSAADRYQNTTTTTRIHSPTGNTPYSYEQTSVTLSPILGIGANYELFAKRFAINAGVTARPFSYTSTTNKRSESTAENKTYTKTVDGYGKTVVDTVTGPAAAITKTNRVNVQDNWGSLSGWATAGFLFNFNENFAVDLLAALGTNDFEGVLTQVNVLFTFKF